jgi:hypothetical protein
MIIAGTLRGSEDPCREKPSLIFVLCDDLGWRDSCCFGSTFHETPNIDLATLSLSAGGFIRAWTSGRVFLISASSPARWIKLPAVCHIRPADGSRSNGDMAGRLSIIPAARPRRWSCVARANRPCALQPAKPRLGASLPGECFLVRDFTPR